MAAQKHRVEVENPPEERVTVHLYGPALQNVDEKLLSDCFTTLLGCAEENACFERGLNVNCLGTIATHHGQTGCSDSAFGLVGARGA